MYTNDNFVKSIFDWKHSSFPAISTETQGNLANDHLMILVSDIILQLGIPVKTVGYAYLIEAIIIKVNAPQADIPVTKILYPSVAKKFNTSSICVERAIRYAIEAAWNRTDSSCRNIILSYSFSQFNRRPTNSESITLIVDRIILLYN